MPINYGFNDVSTSGLIVAGDVLATGSFIVGSGSAANPSFEFTGDPDTGLFSPSANTIGLATSGVERLRISNIGSVGINTTNFNFWDLDNSNLTSTVSISGDLLIQNAINFYTPNEANQYQRGRITSAGDAIFNTLGVGEKQDSFGFAVVMNTNGLVVNNAGVGGSACQLLSDYGAIIENSLIINSNSNGGATVGIGTATPSEALDVTGNVNIDGNLTFDSFTERVVTIGNSSTSKTISLTSGTVQTCTLTGNCTFTMPTATAGKSFSLFLNTGAGSFTSTFTGVRWSDSTSPTITSTASKVDLLSFISDGTYWYGSFSQNYG